MNQVQYFLFLLFIPVQCFLFINLIQQQNFFLFLHTIQLQYLIFGVPFRCSIIINFVLHVIHEQYFFLFFAYDSDAVFF